MQCSFQKCSLRFRKLLSLGKSSSISLNTPDSYTMCSVCWRRCTLQHCTSTPAEAVQAAQVLAEAWKNSRKKHRLHGYYENTVKQIEKLLNILIHVHNMSYVCISMCIYKYISIQPIITCHHSQFSEYVYSPDHIGSAICEKMGRSMSIWGCKGTMKTRGMGQQNRAKFGKEAPKICATVGLNQEKGRLSCHLMGIS